MLYWTVDVDDLDGVIGWENDVTVALSNPNLENGYPAPLRCDECGEEHPGEIGDPGDDCPSCAERGDEGVLETVPGALGWLNSARIVVSGDEVHLMASIGDPRGAFCFTLQRTSDGRYLLHTPYPGESLPHMPTRELHPGTLEVEL